MRVDSIVKSRPNYYELLGLTPSDAGEAISQAFARATSVFRPHTFGSIAEVCLAYQTLRDPVRRRVYDASIGLVPGRPAPPPLRPASARFAQRPALAAAPPVARSTPSVVPGQVTEPVRQISAARPVPPQDTEEARPGPVPRIGGDWSLRPEFEDPAIGIRPIEWKRTGAVIGGLVAAAVFTGAFAGWWSGRDAAEAEQPASSVAVPLPAEEQPPTFSELWPEPAPRAHKKSADRPTAVQPRRATATRAQVERKPNEVDAAAVEPPTIGSLAAETVSTVADPLAPEAAAAPAVSATMPLPHRTVARTIDRIGYSCGKVASATPVEGGAGVYRVTCTTGQSFRAAPVNGRYRFRRIGAN